MIARADLTEQSYYITASPDNPAAFVSRIYAKADGVKYKTVEYYLFSVKSKAWVPQDEVTRGKDYQFPFAKKMVFGETGFPANVPACGAESKDMKAKYPTAKAIIVENKTRKDCVKCGNPNKRILLAFS